VNNQSLAIMKWYTAVLLAAGALYVVSCAPGALWQDSGLIQYRAWHRDIEGFLGLAIAHPLYYLVAIGVGFVPIGEFAHRINLVSAVAGAVAVANLYLLVRLWLGKNFPAAAAAVTLAVSHTFWRHASIAETYTLWTALFLGELIALLRYTETKRIRCLYALALLNGMAVAVHMLGVLPLACYAVLVLLLLAGKTIRPGHAGLVGLFWLLGVAPFGYLVVKEIAVSGDLAGTMASAAFGHRWRGDVLNAALSWRIAKDNLLYLLLNFPTPNALLFFVGLSTLRRAGPGPAFRNTVALLLVLFFVFAFRYTVADRYAFFIPFYSVVAILIGLGIHAVQQRFDRKAALCLVAVFAVLPVPVYAVAPALARRVNVPIGTRGDVAYRDDYRYFLQPWKTGYRGAERFAREALEVVEREAVVIADTTTVGPLLYAQEVKALRPDVSVVTGMDELKGSGPFSGGRLPSRDATEMEKRGLTPLFLAVRPMYVTSDRAGYVPPFVLENYDLVKTGVLWQAVPRQP
jgi:hypothetical protein